MTVITERGIVGEDATGQILFKTAGTTRLTVAPNGAVTWAQDTTGGTIKSVVGGQATITSASAATDSASALSSFQIPHGLAATPTIFSAIPASSAAALASLLGAWVAADATNVYYRTAASVTASKAYSFAWEAHP